jgi:L-asparaginase
LVSERDPAGRRIAVVSTGGTIASVRSDVEAGVTVALPISELLLGLKRPGISDVGPVVELARVNSWNVDPSLMGKLASAVCRLCARDDVDGVVVTHGTDTLEESAFLVDVLAGTDKPVVFTAAMRSADALSPDGPHNLEAALHAAASPALRGLGSMVCLGSELHAARWVRKQHTHSPAAFASGGRSLGTVDPDGVVRRTSGALTRWIAPDVDAPEAFRSDDVLVIAAYTGMSAAVLDAVVDAASPRGIVVDGFGLGHVPASLADPLRALVANGVVVVVSTRVPAGGTWAVYGGPGGGTDLAAMGVLRAGDLSAGKARLLLLACLTGRDPSVAHRMFKQAVTVLGEGMEGAGDEPDL